MEGISFNSLMLHTIVTQKDGMPIAFSKNGKYYCPFCMEELNYKPGQTSNLSTTFRCHCDKWEHAEQSLQSLVDFRKECKEKETELKSLLTDDIKSAYSTSLKELKSVYKEILKHEEKRLLDEYEKDEDDFLKGLSTKETESNSISEVCHS